MRDKIPTLGAILAITLMSAACSSGSSTVRTGTSGDAPPPPAASSSPTLTLTAAQVARELKARGLPVTVAVVYTAATDPNHLLGRAGGYTSKVQFSDPRAMAAGGRSTDTSAGGSVEVCPDHDGAMRRALYIQRATRTSGPQRRAHNTSRDPLPTSRAGVRCRAPWQRPVSRQGRYYRPKGICAF